MAVVDRYGQCVSETQYIEDELTRLYTIFLECGKQPNVHMPGVSFYRDLAKVFRALKQFELLSLIDKQDREEARVLLYEMIDIQHGRKES